MEWIKHYNELRKGTNSKQKSILYVLQRIGKGNEFLGWNTTTDSRMERIQEFSGCWEAIRSISQFAVVFNSVCEIHGAIDIA